MIEMNIEEAVKILRANVMVACDTSSKVGYETPLNRAIEEALNIVINAVEQQHSDDCVSRQAVDHLCFEYLRANTDDNIAFYEHFRDLLPVTSVHGICKNCSHRDPEDKMCDCGHSIT